MKNTHWISGALVILAVAVLGFFMNPETGEVEKTKEKTHPVIRATSPDKTTLEPSVLLQKSTSSAHQANAAGTSATSEPPKCGCANCGKDAVSSQKIKHDLPALKMTAAIQKELFGHSNNTPITFALPGGESAKGSVNFIREENGETVMVQGLLTKPQKGYFFFQKQSMPGVAGSIVGLVAYDKSAVAYSVVTGADGTPELHKKNIDEVLCNNYGHDQKVLSASAIENAPEDHPNITVIPDYQSDVIPLESFPGAPGVLYLDFDGHEGPVESWPVEDMAHSGLTNAEIKETWEHVAEDFAPFNFNVTTDLEVYRAAQENSRMRVLITPTSPSPSGGAIIGSFNWTGDVPCFVGYLRGKPSHEGISHELGHTLGLFHDGINAPNAASYYGGAGNGATGWAPIMGISYYKQLSQWNKGEYPRTTNTQDDFALMLSNNNVTLRTDDHAETLAAATYMGIKPDNTVSNQGIIERRTDFDSFRFTTTGTGTVVFNVSGASHDSNLDILAEVVNSSGSVVASDNPDLALNANINVTLPAGDYFLRISGTGRGNVAVDGYSDYGSRGYYKVSGSIPNSVQPKRLSIAENSANGSSVGVITPNNNHPANSTTFSISSGNSNGAFALNPSTGELTVANSSKINYEKIITYYGDVALAQIFVDVTNSASSSLSERLRVEINVTDVNEPHSIIGDPNINIFQNDVVNGLIIGSFYAKGEDSYSSSMSWSISSGNADNTFEISSKGVVKVRNASQFLAESSHNLQITAVDSGPPLPVITANKSITVTSLKWNPGNDLIRNNWTQKPGVTATQSSVIAGGVASRAIDGNTSGYFNSNSVTHTDPAQSNAWLEVDLGADRSLGSVRLYNRIDCCSKRLSNFRISVLDASRAEVAGQDYYLSSGMVGESEMWTIPTTVTGRYVRVQVYGNNNLGDGTLAIAEIEVFENLPTSLASASSLSNLTQQSGVTATQSSTAHGGNASRAIDGNVSGNWSDGSVTHTDAVTTSNWLEVDLGNSKSISSVSLFNRTDCCGERLSNFRVTVLDAARAEVAGKSFHENTGNVGISESWTLSSPTSGRYVRVELIQRNNTGGGVLALAELQIFGNNNPTQSTFNSASILSNLTQLPGVKATQSSTAHGGNASRAIDGNVSGNWSDGSVMHTDAVTTSNWLEVDLGKSQSISSVSLFNRTDCCGERLSNFRVTVLNAARAEVTGKSFHENTGNVGISESWTLSSPASGRYVRVQLIQQNNTGDGALALAELQIFGYNTPTQSTTGVGANALRAVDGNRSGNFAENSVTLTDATSANWWEIKFTSRKVIEQLAIYNRTDCCGDRLSNFRVSLWDGETEIYGSNHFTKPGTSAGSIFTLVSGETLVGDRLRIQSLGSNSAGDRVLSLAEVEIYGVDYIPSPPTIKNASFAVTENHRIGTTVGTVSATPSIPASLLTYAITGGNGAGHFSIDTNNGAITTTTALDFETTPSYSLTVKVTDSSGLSNTATVTTTVNNLVESSIDSDGDGVHNVIEIAQGTSPSLASSTPASHYAGLVGWWKLDETTSNNILDSSGYNNAGTNFSTSSISGKDGKARDFNGFLNSIRLQNPAILNITGQVTMSAWVKPESTTNFRNILAHGYGTAPNGEVALRISDGQYQVGSWNGTSVLASGGNANADLNTWVHILGAYDGTHWRLYRNGVQIAVTQSSQGAVAVNESWAIASRGNGGSRHFEGGIDDVRIHNRGLSAVEVTSLYNLIANPTLVANAALIAQAPAIVNVNQAPNFANINGSDAEVSVTYVARINNVTSGALAYSKVSGPTWLSIASDGSITGTPAHNDVGANQWLVRATNTVGLSSDATLDITVKAVSPVSSFAIANTIKLGTTSDSYTNTQSNDGVIQSFTEVVVDSGTEAKSQLESQWEFTLAGGSAVILRVDAFHSANTEGDDFIFAYSTDGITFTDVLTVTKVIDDGVEQTADLPANLSGTVYIRVKDADQTNGNAQKDSLYVDLVTIEVTP